MPLTHLVLLSGNKMNKKKGRVSNSKTGTWIGVGVALGAGIGTALFSATQEPVWIGVGVALGAALGISETEKNKAG